MSNDENKMTFADFVEHTMAVQYLEYQKDYLNRLYEKMKCGEKIIFLPARGSNRTDWSLLYTLMLTIYEEQFERSKNDQI